MYEQPRTVDLEFLASKIRQYDQRFRALIREIETSPVTPSSAGEQIRSLESDLRRLPLRAA